MTASLIEQLRGALKHELPSTNFDEDTIEWLSNAVQGADGEGSLDEVIDTWAPFLISYNAAETEEAARDLCCSVLNRLGNSAALTELPSIVEEVACAGVATKQDPVQEGTKNEVELAQQLAPGGKAEVQGLAEWLKRLKLEEYADEAQLWCDHRGATDTGKILDNWESFSDELGLKKLERKRVKRDSEQRYGVAAKQAPQTVDVSPPDRCEGGNQHSFGPPEDPYVILSDRELGAGTTATVYRCIRRCRPEEPLAVKIIDLTRLRLHTDPSRALDKLHRETAILFSLKHPHIVSLYDVIETREKLYLVMELVEGGELFKNIAVNGRLAEPEARYIFLQLADALQYIHSKNIVHRDLKPENILIDRKESRPGQTTVKISDFGHSKLIDGYSTALTHGVGTPEYWAPEVCDARRCATGYDYTVDLWSLGVVLFVMLEGRYPFDMRAVGLQQQGKLQYKEGSKTSQEARDLIGKLIRLEPRRRLPLEDCLKHPWAVRPGQLPPQVADAPRQDGQRLQADEERFKIRVELQDPKRLRRDLLGFTTRHKVSAVLRMGEVVVDWGHSEKASREATRSELVQLLACHFLGSGRPPPGGGPAELT